MAPDKLTLRTYRVGFGDCFLLTFHYKDGNRYVLIDFGSTGTTEGAQDATMLRIANDIKHQCGGKLHAVVATHRHKDHISGFATKKNGKGSGDIIASCKPDLVIQPWTEDPKAKPNAKTPTTVITSNGSSLALSRAFVASLQNMHAVSAFALDEVKKGQGMGVTAKKKISFLGDDNLSNLSAVENLMTMAKRNAYVHYGSKSGLESVLPGIKVSVLGPPTLEQSASIAKQKSRDKNEFWQIAAFWSFQAQAGHVAATRRARLFPGYAASKPPVHARWLLRRLQSVRGDQLLQIVRALDSVMNNTSVILLFQVGSKSLLFPGDAQIENWSYALNQPGVKKTLAKVDLYKVGHHGSLNATPKTLWNNFRNRSTKQTSSRLKTVVSTMAGKHGDTKSGTEVPRRTLVEALEKESDYFSTQQIKGKDLFHDLTISL